MKFFAFKNLGGNLRVLGTKWCIYELNECKTSSMTQNRDFGSDP